MEVGGYTPGDTWDLYVGKDGRIVQFVYHRGRTQEAEVTSQQLGPATRRVALSLSQQTIAGRRTASRRESSFRMWSVKLVGSDAWVDAQIGKRAGLVASIDVDLHDSNSRAITTVVQELPSLGRSAICGHADPQAGALPTDDGVYYSIILSVRGASHQVCSPVTGMGTANALEALLTRVFGTSDRSVSATTM